MLPYGEERTRRGAKSKGEEVFHFKTYPPPSLGGLGKGAR
jgi:hypothetical protein